MKNDQETARLKGIVDGVNHAPFDPSYFTGELITTYYDAYLASHKAMIERPELLLVEKQDSPCDA